MQYPLVLFLTALQKQISTFIWDSKAPHCANSTLTRPHCKGGVGLPRICTYYHAIALDQYIILVKSHHRKNMFHYRDLALST